MLNISLVFLLSYIFVFYAIPSVIRVANLKRLYDDPALEERKTHKYRVPNLGGIAVLTCFAFSACLFISGEILPYANYIFASGLLIFSMGCIDDLMGLNPYKKFLTQFITAFIVVYFANIRILSFDGLLGIYTLQPILSYAFSVLLVVFIINAFNLVDGINGLLGTVSLIAGLTLSILFFRMGQMGLALMGFSLCGAVLGFLRYNFGNNARIFMGDAGAYTIGLILAVLAIKFAVLNCDALAGVSHPPVIFHSAPAIGISILIIPMFDTLRVFFLRLISGQSPFLADRRHLHHRLLDIGLNHMQATVILGGVNVFMLTMALVFQGLGTSELLMLVTIVAFILNALLWLYDVKAEKNNQAILVNDAPINTPVSVNLNDDAKQVAQEAMRQNKN